MNYIYANSMAVGMAVTSGSSATMVQAKITLTGISMKFGLYIHGPQRTNWNLFGDSLTLLQPPSSGQEFNLSNTSFYDPMTFWSAPAALC